MVCSATKNGVGVFVSDLPLRLTTTQEQISPLSSPFPEVCFVTKIIRLLDCFLRFFGVFLCFVFFSSYMIYRFDLSCTVSRGAL